jgi:hypothetical protein
MTRARELTETENKQRELNESELDAVSGGTKSGGTVAAGWDIKASSQSVTMEFVRWALSTSNVNWANPTNCGTTNSTQSPAGSL